MEQEDEDGGGEWTGWGRSELSREESVNLSLFRWGHHTALGSWRALVGRQESAEGRFCCEENETAQHLWVWCSAFMVGRWRAWFGESLRELVETTLRASTLLRAILRCLKWSTTKTAPSRQHLPIRAQHNMLCLQRLLIFCLYICSTYKIYGICNILSLRELLVDQVSAFNASHRVHSKPYEHRLHKGISQSDYRISFFETRIFIFPLFTFMSLLSIAALHMLKHSTTSLSCTGGFVNICPTPAVAIDTIMESSSRVRQHEYWIFFFFKDLNWILTPFLTCTEVLKSL